MDCDQIYCTPCSPGCQTCTGGLSNQCQACDPTYCFNSDNVCIAHDRTYSHPTDDTCQSCIVNCAACSDGTTCNDCDADYFVNSDSVCGLRCNKLVDLGLGNKESPPGKTPDANNELCIDCDVAEKDYVCVTECPPGWEIGPDKRCVQCVYATQVYENYSC